MRHVPYLNCRDLELHRDCFEEAFINFSRNSDSADSQFLKFSGNTVEIPGFGDSTPEFLPPEPIDLIIVSVKKMEEYERTPYGIDERYSNQTGLMVEILTSTYTNNNLTNRDRISINDVLYHVTANKQEHGMGQTSLVTELVLFEITQ